MNTPKIEKGIPLPKVKIPGRPTSTPYINEMEVDDSVFVEDRVTANRLRANMSNRGWLPALRKIDGGFRVWRVE